MTAKVIPLPALPAMPADPPVSVEWDPVECVYNAVCARCAEGLSTPWLCHAHDWAETHRCDPELAALLDAITGSAA